MAVKGRVVGKPAAQQPGPMLPGVNSKKRPGPTADLTEYEPGTATSGLGEQLAAKLAEQAALVVEPQAPKTIPQPMAVKPPRTSSAPAIPQSRPMAPTAQQARPMATPPVRPPVHAAPVLEDGVLKEALTAPATLSSIVEQVTRCPPGYSRIEVPSRCKPYKAKGVTDIFVRPLLVEDAWAIASAVEANDYTSVIDALQPAVVQDLRDLTEPDFTYIRYWLRINSYKRSPYTFRWLSRYGNRLQRVLSMANLETIELKLTDEEIAEYAAKGICFPTVRDAEAIANAKNDTRNSILSLADRAQYVVLPPAIAEQVAPGQWLQARIEYLKTQPVEFLEDVRDFRDKAQHGVREFFEATDDK